MSICDETCGCPLKESCLGRRFDEWAGIMRGHWESGDPIRRAHIIARSRGTYSRPDPELSKPGAPPPPPRDEPKAAPARDCTGDVRAQLANIARVKACPSWEATSGCGCGVNRCRAGKGRPEDNGVTYEDCFRCLGIGTCGIPK